ncbi:MAG: tetratricopeptide repeat protein [Bacilli bacterium]
MAREGKYGEAKKYLQTAIDHATKNYTVAKDVEPIYYMAVVQHKTGQIKQAKDNYWKATWRPEFKVPSYFALAQIACSERKYKDALELIDSCIQFNSKNVKALVLKAYILRKLGCEDGAEKALELAMEIDKLDYFALAEQGFLDGKECALSKYEKQMGDRLQNILKRRLTTKCRLSRSYFHFAMLRENADQSKLSPMVNYYIGYYKALNGDADAKDAYAAAAKAPTDIASRSGLRKSTSLIPQLRQIHPTPAPTIILATSITSWNRRKTA